MLLKINREKYLTPIELVGPQDVYQMMNVLNTNSSGVYSNREEGILGTWDEYDEGLKVWILHITENRPFKLNRTGKTKFNNIINPQAPVTQKIAHEVVFRRFQGEGVEFFF